MEENNLVESEQVEKTASEFGKFESAEQLLRAYNALEAEFTKRCQRLKELEQIAVKTADEVQSAEKILQDALSDEDFIDSRIASDPIIAEKVIRNYLSSLSERPSAQILSGITGRSALTPIKRPKSLEEAKRLADRMLR